MNRTRIDHLRPSPESVAARLRLIADQARELAEIIETKSIGESDSRAARDPRRVSRLLDSNTFSVRWEKRTCHLGYTLSYRIIAYLAGHANRYVSHQQLLDDVWGGPRSGSAVRSAIAELRARLVRSGMGRLASAIDGSNSGHYGLFLS